MRDIGRRTTVAPKTLRKRLAVTQSILLNMNNIKQAPKRCQHALEGMETGIQAVDITDCPKDRKRLNVQR